MKKLLSFLYIAVCAGIGFWLGYLSLEGGLIFEFTVFQLGLLFMSLLVFGCLHILIHEAGHLIAGKLSGYHMIFIRIFSWALVKEGEKFRFAKFSIAGTGGQCLMVPPKMTDGALPPYKLYLWGGVLANFAASGISLLAAVFLTHSVYLYSFAAIGILLGLTNIFPYFITDGMQLKQLKNDTIKQQQFFQQLHLTEAFTLGKTYDSLDMNALIVNPNEPNTEQYNTYIQLVKINHELEASNFGHALDILKPLWQQRVDLIQPYQMEVMREYLFCHLTLELQETTIQEDILGDKLFKEYMKLKQLESYRLQAAVAFYVERDIEKAEEWLQKAREALDKAPTYADKVLNTTLLNGLSQKIKKDKAEKITASSLKQGL
ncbi:hypothetical protein [Marinilactibacillus piezotolerans]|uniref:hypothetical protein n=1 Tax=Marinilactibacillus piezotolerans TaxID=258723 RepID=UPI0009B16962|nr:hypothetical protein [Marinilactibacillus piezotolerans]